MLEEIFATHIFKKQLLSNIKHCYNSVSEESQFLKGKEFNRDCKNDTWMANKNMKDVHHSVKCKLKKWDSIPHSLEQLKVKKSTTPNVGHNSRRIQNGRITLENSVVVSYKVRHRLIMWPRKKMPIKTITLMYRTFSIITKYWDQLTLFFKGEWISNLWHIHTIDY